MEKQVGEVTFKTTTFTLGFHPSVFLNASIVPKEQPMPARAAGVLQRIAFAKVTTINGAAWPLAEGFSIALKMKIATAVNEKMKCRRSRSAAKLH